MNTLVKNLEKVNRISKYRKNWDGYGAEPIPKRIIDETDIILIGLAHNNLPQPFIAPLSEDIQMEWKEPNGKYLEIEIKEKSDNQNPYKYNTFLCLDSDNNVHSNFQFALDGEVEKTPHSVYNLIKLFYGRKN